MLIVIIIFGFLFPPLAVAVRFGIGKDFFINLVLTICGYIPGHGHNFFIQNIRDNTNAKRTPKWAIRYGLVDDSHAKKQAKSRQWTGRYNDTLPERTQYDDDGNAIKYGSHHRFEDGVDPNGAGRNSRRHASGGAESTLVDEDSFYNTSGHDAASSDPYSLRRSRSNLSGGGAPGSDERRQARSKSKARAMFGRKKGTGDRHAKADQVMGDGASYNGSWNDDDSSLRGGARDPLYDDGPEDADSRYRPGAGGRSGGAGYSSSKQLPHAPSRDDSRSSNPRHPNDGLDHTF